MLNMWYVQLPLFFEWVRVIAILSYEKSIASSKASSQQNAIQCFLFKFLISSRFLKVIPQQLTSSSSYSRPFIVRSVKFFDTQTKPILFIATLQIIRRSKILFGECGVTQLSRNSPSFGEPKVLSILINAPHWTPIIRKMNPIQNTHLIFHKPYIFVLP